MVFGFFLGRLVFPGLEVHDQVVSFFIAKETVHIAADAHAFTDTYAHRNFHAH